MEDKGNLLIVRQTGEAFLVKIGEEVIKVIVTRVKGDKVRLAIQATKDNVLIQREEEFLKNGWRK